MTPDQLAAIRARHRLTVGQYQLSPAELDRGELLAEVDRLTASLAAAEAERDNWKHRYVYALGLASRVLHQPIKLLEQEAEEWMPAPQQEPS